MRALCKCLVADKTDQGFNLACYRLAMAVNMHDTIIDTLRELYLASESNMLPKDLDDKVKEIIEREEFGGRIIDK